MRGGGVLFFLVCKKNRVFNLSPTGHIFSFGRGGREGLYFCFSLCFSLRLVALFDSRPVTQTKRPKTRFFLQTRKNNTNTPPNTKKNYPPKKKSPVQSSPVQILVQSSPIQSPVLDSCENEHRTFSIFMKKKKRILLSWVANQIAVEID